MSHDGGRQSYFDPPLHPHGQHAPSTSGAGSPPLASSTGRTPSSAPPWMPPSRYAVQPYWQAHHPSALTTSSYPLAGPSSPYPSVISQRHHPSRAPTIGPQPGSTNPRPTVSQFLEHLDLSEYTGILLADGFDRMESLLDIQEDDFAALGIKRGHRRIIQRELASMKGIPWTTPLSVGNKDPHIEDEDSGREIHQTNRNTFYLERQNTATPSQSEPSTKRKYRRHPKPDPNAPIKPPSAYVEFSNTIREEHKGKSFTEIARLVGEQWQSLDKDEKERLESHAAQEKIRYSALLAHYKTTVEYTKYQNYLSDFRKKHPQDDAGAGTPSQTPGDGAHPTPPPLVTRSSGEESAIDAPVENSPVYPPALPLPSPEYRKRQRIGSTVEAEQPGIVSWDRDALSMRLMEPKEGTRITTAMSDVRGSSVPSAPPPELLERSGVVG